MFSRIGHGVFPNYGRLAQASRPAHGCSPNVLAAFSGLGYSPASGCSGMGMVQRVATVAFEGIEARSVTVQVQVAPGLPAFKILSSINFYAIMQLISRLISASYEHITRHRSPSRLFLRENVDPRTAEGRQPPAPERSIGALCGEA